MSEKWEIAMNKVIRHIYVRSVMLDFEFCNKDYGKTTGLMGLVCRTRSDLYLSGLTDKEIDDWENVIYPRNFRKINISI